MKNLISNELMEELSVYMDTDIRECIHFKFAPCSAETFLKEYLKLDKTNLLILDLLRYHGINVGGLK